MRFDKGNSFTLKLKVFKYVSEYFSNKTSGPPKILPKILNDFPNLASC